MSLPYFPLYPSDFDGDTRHLSLLEDGVYNRLLRLCWQTSGCSVPNDPQWLFRRLSARTEEEQRAVLAVVEEFFEVRRGRLHNPRLTREHEKATARHKAASENGKKGSRPVKPMKNRKKDESYGFAAANPQEGGGFATANPQEGGGFTTANPRESSQPDDSGEKPRVSNLKGGPDNPLKNNDSGKSYGLTNQNKIYTPSETTSPQDGGAVTPDEHQAPDLTKVVFDTVVAMLTGADLSERQARSNIGRWRKSYPDERIFSALRDAQRVSAVEPVAYVDAALKGGQTAAKARRDREIGDQITRAALI